MSSNRRRREPKQERARATVEAIKEATAQLLVEHGFHKTSTNKIAERAGVSVGSVYQYFRDKEAIVSALVESFATEQFEFLAGRLADIDERPLKDGVRELVNALLEARKLNPELDKVLFEELPAVEQINVWREWTESAVAIVAVALSARSDEIEIEDYEMAAYTLVNACHGIVHGTVINRTELLGDAALSDHITRLVLAYLTHPNDL